MYAIVDIETTGGHASSNGITEICIFLHDGEKVTGQYLTLINPGMEIPRYIESFTGITNEMVAKAPAFSQVAETIFNYLNGPIFIAHNVNFDYSFIKYALGICGYELNSKKLCTVRLSRKIIPGYSSYSLGNLCGYLKIPISDRHRAQGDAEATVKLFELLLKRDNEEHINQMLKRNSKEQVLPPNLPKEQFDSLPDKPGIYYFHNQAGKIIYIGKAKSIKSRVSSHFSNNSPNRQKQNFMRDIYTISFEETATELMALLLESHEIKHHWPEFNKAQKRYDAQYGLYDYEDRNGIIRLGFELMTKHRHVKPLLEFSSKIQAIENIQLLASEYDLCPQLCGVQLTCANETCACKKQETVFNYNAKVNDLIIALSNKDSYLIVDKGRNKKEYSAIWVDKGKLIGMGYVPKNIEPNNMDEVITFIKKYKENFFMQNQVANFANNYPEKLVWL
ncbi:MAG: exonuclease domain-containing protein [Bacteroidota bacterium]